MGHKELCSGRALSAAVNDTQEIPVLTRFQNNLIYGHSAAAGFALPTWGYRYQTRCRGPVDICRSRDSTAEHKYALYLGSVHILLLEKGEKKPKCR